MTDGQISQIEGGTRADPKFSTIARLAAAIGVSLDAISAECGYLDESADMSSKLPESARQRLSLLRSLRSAKSTATKLIEEIDAAVTPPTSTVKKKSRRKR